MKYTYDYFCLKTNGHTAGKGAKSLKGQITMMNRFVLKYPLDTHVIIRRPDNKIMNVYDRRLFGS